MDFTAFTAKDAQAQDLLTIFTALRDGEYGAPVEHALKLFVKTSIGRLMVAEPPEADTMVLFTTKFSGLCKGLLVQPSDSSIPLSVQQHSDILDFFINMTTECLIKSRQTDINILELFLSTLIEIRRDPYGMPIESSTPLIIDRLMEGRALKSRASLLRLPVELIGEVLKHVPLQSLSAFALVNSDCRQLARSRQFLEIRFDYSDKSLHLLRILLCEAIERRQNKRTNSPSLGACIRRVVVATNPGWITQRHSVDFKTINELDHDTRAIKLHRAAGLYSNYIQLVGAVLATALPHLDAIQWFDTRIIQKTVFQSFAKSRVRHLRLDRVHIDESFELDTARSAWPLETLSLRIARQLDPVFINAKLCTNLLRLCSQSLKHLDWRSQFHNAPQSFGLNLADYPVFPLLRELRLQSFNFEDDSVLQALLPNMGCKIRTLFVDTFQTTASKSFFSSRGRVEALRSLGLGNTNSALKQQCQFIAANPQLTQLYIQDRLPSSFIGEQLAPFLCKSFNRLASLSLVWEGTEIDDKSLGSISNIDSLEQLHLSSGTQSGSIHDWPINHETMRAHLARLPNLKKLAFSRDSYLTGPDDWLLEYYYETYQLNEEIALLSGVPQMNAVQADAPVQPSDPSQLDNLVQPDAAQQAGTPTSFIDNEDDSGPDHEVAQESELGGNQTNLEEQSHNMHNYNEESDVDASVNENESDDNSWSDYDEDEDDDDEDDDFMGGSLNGRKKKWEEEHLERMLVYGDQYFAEFPRLEWLYLGQIPMVPMGNRKAKPVGVRGKDDCYISKTFGWPYGED
jgi:hypothetical protein